MIPNALRMDGFAVAEHIRDHPALAGVTILMLTSDNRAGDAARARALGMASYLVKPVRRADLLDAIHRAIERPSGRHSPRTLPSGA